MYFNICCLILFSFRVFAFIWHWGGHVVNRKGKTKIATSVNVAALTTSMSHPISNSACMLSGSENLARVTKVYLACSSRRRFAAITVLEQQNMQDCVVQKQRPRCKKRAYLLPHCTMNSKSTEMKT